MLPIVPAVLNANATEFQTSAATEVGVTASEAPVIMADSAPSAIAVEPFAVKENVVVVDNPDSAEIDGLTVNVIPVKLESIVCVPPSAAVDMVKVDVRLAEAPTISEAVLLTVNVAVIGESMFHP